MSDYWERRKARDMWEYMEDAEKTADEVAKVYAKASEWMSRQISEIFSRYKTKHGLTTAAAKILLNKMRGKSTIQALKSALDASEDDEEKQKLMQQLESSAYRARIERLELLQKQLDQVMQNVYQAEKKITTKHYIELGKKAYYKNVYNIQKQTGIGFSFNLLNPEVLDRTVKSTWSGENYSKRIWHNTQELAQDMKTELTVNLVTGRTDREVAEEIGKKYGQGASNARRLVRTESCHLTNQMEMKSYEECGIERYRFIATLDLKTSTMCRELDGKTFPVSEQSVGKNCPPMHPWCRSTTVCDLSEEEIEGMTRNARDPENPGKTKKVPVRMTYQEWYNQNVKEHPKALLNEKKIKNYTSDKRQFENYKKNLGEAVPKTLDKFQDIKYTEPKKWKSLQKEFWDSNLRKKIQSDAINKTIETGKQGKHIRGHNNYRKGTSYLTISLEEAQQIVNKYAGTGELKRDKNGKWTHKEFVSIDSEIGVVLIPNTDRELATSRFSIHYSKKGVHIVPREGD